MHMLIERSRKYLSIQLDFSEIPRTLNKENLIKQVISYRKKIHARTRERNWPNLHLDMRMIKKILLLWSLIIWEHNEHGITNGIYELDFEKFINKSVEGTFGEWSDEDWERNDTHWKKNELFFDAFNDSYAHYHESYNERVLDYGNNNYATIDMHETGIAALILNSRIIIRI